jgi:hypothetical protein
LSFKDRWRQILNEAVRIPHKHLLTLEPSISENQTNEMKGEHVQLVLLKSIHPTYSEKQRSWLMDLSTFTEYVGRKQS